MVDKDKDAAAVRIPPPVIYLGGVIVGALLHAFVLPLPIGLTLWLQIATAVAATVLTIVFIAGAIKLFRSTDQDPKPWKSTPEIISTGIYRITRNPMYIAMAFLQIAIGVGLANWWIIILVPVALAGVYQTAIRHEEFYLEGKFGEDYTRYKSSVRRWL